MLFTSDISTHCCISLTKKPGVLIRNMNSLSVPEAVCVLKQYHCPHLNPQKSPPFCFFSYEQAQVYLTATPSQTHTNTSAGIVKIQRLFLYCSDENWSNESEVIPASCTWFLFEAMCAWALWLCGGKKKREGTCAIASFFLWTTLPFLVLDFLWFPSVALWIIYIGNLYRQSFFTDRTHCQDWAQLVANDPSLLINCIFVYSLLT